MFVYLAQWNMHSLLSDFRTTDACVRGACEMHHHTTPFFLHLIPYLQLCSSVAQWSLSFVRGI